MRLLSLGSAHFLQTATAKASLGDTDAAVKPPELGLGLGAAPSRPVPPRRGPTTDRSPTTARTQRRHPPPRTDNVCHGCESATAGPDRPPRPEYERDRSATKDRRAN